jgi:hypothetical protein
MKQQGEIQMNPFDREGLVRRFDTPLIPSATSLDREVSPAASQFQVSGNASFDIQVREKGFFLPEGLQNEMPEEGFYLGLRDFYFKS